MGRLNEKIRRFLWGRYGIDPLYHLTFWSGFALLMLGMILGAVWKGTWLGLILQWSLFAVGMGLYAYTMFRVLSRNIPARQRELARYGAFCRFWRAPFRRLRMRMRDRKTHIYRKCPGCKKTLRLPRVKGEHTVCCPVCRHRFGVKVK